LHFYAISLVLAIWVVAALIYPTQTSAEWRSVAFGEERSANVWGGQHIAITMTDAGAEIEFDCATGTISAPLTVDPNGKFQADGTYTREHGGPVQRDEPGAVAAKYSGTIAGNTMHLDIVLSQSKESAGSYVLTKGQAGKVFKCR
jgi:hypothetical protein